MNSPICVSKICVTHRKQIASFWIARSTLAIAPLWLMLAASNTSAQMSEVSTSTTTTSTSAPPSNWSQFLEDNMQRSNPNETILGVNTVGNLVEKWGAEISVGCCESPQSSPAVVNGVLYYGVVNSVNALNLITSAPLWTFPTNGVASSPAVVNGVVYITAGSGTLYALNASTGAKLWTFTTGNAIESSPAVVNGVVYIGSDDRKVYALNASTGAKLWSFTTGDAVGYSSPAVANGAVYIGSRDGHFYALNATTGAYQWSWAINTQGASAAVANGVVYITEGDGTLYALNGTTGAKLWSDAIGNFVNSPPAVANGVVYVSSDKLYALNAGTGARLWTFPIGGSAPVVANGVVYFSGGSLYALNASTGAQLWTFPFGGSLLAVADGMLFVHTAGGADPVSWEDGLVAFGLGADLFLRISPTPTTVHQGDLLTYEFPVWNLGPVAADQESLMTQVPTGTTFDYIRISGTLGLGTCTTPPYQTIGQVICHQNGSMAPNTTWTVRLTVKVTAPAGAIIFENGATLANGTNDPNMANNTASVRVTVQ
jgi:outer membrane protein assembly factor BamB